MRFRTRLFVAVSLATTATLFVSFASVSFVVEHSEERQLDEALHVEAYEAAADIALNAKHRLQVSDRPGSELDDLSRLLKYAVLYESSQVVDSTSAFKGAPPPSLPSLMAVHSLNTPFDIRFESENVRAILTHVPDHPELILLLGASRADMERDVRFLREVMLVAALVSLGWIVLISFTIARGLTRDHAAIAQTARRVSAGDLKARVSLETTDDETATLARDVDQMIDRLEILVGSQQRFVAHAAHELRSPLTSFYGELQLALRRKRTAEEYEAAIQHALGSARDLKRLADDLLVLARLGADQAAPKEPIDLAATIDHALGWLREKAKTAGVELSIDVPEDIEVSGRTLDIERLLGNLVDNALRFAPPQSAVEIRARRLEGVVELTVSDEGPGVAEADRDRIFEPFFRSDTKHNDPSGGGLGLSIARGIARAHGGDLVLRDTPTGACFVATLALAEPPPTSE